jgi:uridine phosphorylase
MTKKIGSSELIVNPDGSIFHLKIKPGQIANDIILVGDPARVHMVASFFDKIELEMQNREFTTITGEYHGKRLTVLSTGIGTDNIDIVLNELDALVNIDLPNREIKVDHTSLNIIRIGTSGALQTDIPIYSFLITKKSIGIDGLMNFYAHHEKVTDLSLQSAFKKHTHWNPLLASPYAVDSNELLFSKIFDHQFIEGITISAPGFYAPQGRELRLKTADPGLINKIESFLYNNMKITNYEMESSAIYGLSKLMGHQALTVCLIIANRIVHDVGTDYQPNMERLVKLVLDKLTY